GEAPSARGCAAGPLPRAPGDCAGDAPGCREKCCQPPELSPDCEPCCGRFEKEPRSAGALLPVPAPRLDCSSGVLAPGLPAVLDPPKRRQLPEVPPASGPRSGVAVD